MAFRAGDSDFTLSPGYPDRLATTRTAVVPMLAVLYLSPKHQKSLVFLVSPVSIPGKLKGSTIFEITLAQLQPRSCAASMTLLSIFVIIEYRGVIMKGR